MGSLKNIAVFIADKIDITGIQILRKSGINVLEFPGLENNELINKLSALPNFKIVLIIRSTRKLGKKELKIIKKLGNVVLICTASSGFDNIDTIYARRLKYKILNVPNGNYISAAEHTLAVILCILKNITASNSLMKNGIFGNSEYTNQELKGKIIGIIGVGRVGSYVARLCRQFGMKILGHDIKKSLKYKYRWIEFVSLSQILKRSDIITVHTPLDESTKNLINRSKLLMMKKGSVLINCARGGIVNEKALIMSLKSRKLSYAGLDVFVNEPFFNKEFTKLDNVLLTPHLAGKSRESKVRISVQLAQNILMFINKYEKLFN
jgi:D-3-phosphoglycerate dehydrogenase